MQGIVQKIEFTKNGAKKLQIGGVWYFAGKVDMDAAKVGDKIDFTFNEFGEDRGKGRLKGIQDWKPVTDASGRPQTGSTISDADILRSVSNIVGNACSAGTIKGAEELEKWCLAARMGLTQAMSQAKPKEQSNGATHDPDFNDPLPESFYEGLPPPRTRSTGAGF